MLHKKSPFACQVTVKCNGVKAASISIEGSLPNKFPLKMENRYEILAEALPPIKRHLGVFMVLLLSARHFPCRRLRRVISVEGGRVRRVAVG